MPSLFRRNRVWLLLVTGTAAGSTLSPPSSDLVLGIVVLSALALTVSSARRLKGSVGWRRITIGSVLIGFAPALTEIHRSVDASAGPLTIGDLVLVVGYGLFLAGLQWVLTARTMALQARALLDASLATLWIGFVTLAWAGPQLAARLSGYPLIASLLYLPLSLAIVFLLLRLILGSSSRSPSMVLLAGTAGLAVASELSFLALAAGQEGARRIGVGAATLALVLLAAAIRHRSARELETPTPEQQEPMSSVRTSYIVLSFAAITLSLAVFPRPGSHLIVMLAAIGAVTVANLVLTIRSRERLLNLERHLRQSVADLMRADRPEQMLALGGRAIDHLLIGKVTSYGEFVIRDGDQWVTVPDRLELRPSPAELEAMAAAVGRWKTFREELRSIEPQGGYMTRLVVPMIGVNDHAELLMVEASPVLTTAEIEQLQQVTAIVERALIAYDLQEEAHLRRADQRFRALVQDSGDVVTLVDPETLEVRMVSPSMQRILGYPEEDFVGAPADRYFHPGDQPVCRQLLSDAFTRPQAVAVDLRIRHSDGHFHWFSATVRDHTSDNEVGGLVMNLTDIQDRKMAEISLVFSEQRYRALVHNSKDVFAVLETDLTINYISPNVETVLGFPSADLVASNLTSLLTDESAERLNRFIVDARGVMQGDVVELELRTRTRNTCVAEVTLSEQTGDANGTLMVTISDVTDRRRLERSLRNQALYDGLTGLAKRSTLHFELQKRLQQLRATEYLGLIHLDVNDFKAINQSVGYEKGDELLVQVATRLRASLRSTDYLARLGGNEFAVAVTTEDRDEILAFAERVLELFERPFEVAGKQHRLTVSIGVEVTDDRRTVAQNLLERASLAVGAARNETHGTVRVFEPEMRVTATERFELVADLQGAIGRNELSVVYQPIVEIDTRNVRGVEALLRWSHPERGPISPGVFIPLAEKSGTVVELGRWVMTQACAQLRQWHETVDGAEALGMSVNVSALQLERKGEAERLCQIVVDSAVDPSRVTAELTESTLIEDGGWIRSQLQTLRDQGMRVAIDDFGTGAAGLSHLRNVPFNVIKIDKSYVDALSESAEAQRLVRGVIDLAHTLGAETVAEGIEEPTEFDLLQSLGCELGQGFYLGRPMDPAQLEDWFAKGRSGAVPALIAKPARR